MQTIAELIRYATEQLADLDSGRLDAELLLADLLHCDRAYIFSHPESVVTTKNRQKYEKNIQRRRQGEPLAYIKGKKEFWSMSFNVSQATLIPRPETELLIETALNNISVDSKATILDLCTGSGIIAICIAKSRARTNIIASDISAAALAIAQQNIKNLHASNVTCIESDLFATIDHTRFNLILSNPPYINSTDDCLFNSDIRYEPRIALDGGENGLEYINSIIKQAFIRLHDDGLLIMEHGNTQAKQIRDSLLENHYADIQTLQDYAGHDRITLARKVKCQT